MKLKKILTLMCCAVLLVCISVGATVAYLTSQTDVVTNTFTTGNVALTLDEAKVTDDGKYVSDATNRGNTNTYKLMPGHTYIKDPTVHVGEGSEVSYLFVKVTNDIAGIEDATTIANQMTANGWKALDGVDGVYAYNATVKAGDDIVVFEEFKILGNVDNDTLATYKGKTITVQAYAVQADGFTSAAAAYAAAPCTWGPKTQDAE